MEPYGNQAIHVLKVMMTDAALTSPSKMRTSHGAERRKSALEKLLLQGSSFDALLIKSVKERPTLYNSKSYEYKDQGKRNKAWAEIAAITGVNVNHCHVRWKQLRDRYVREKKYELTHPGSSARWHLTKAMDFIGAYIRHRRRFRSKKMMPEELTIAIQPSEELSGWAVSESDHSHRFEIDGATVPGEHNSSGLPVFVELVEGADSDSFISAEPTNDEGGEAMLVMDEPTPRANADKRFQQDDILTGKADTGDEEELFGLSVAATLKRFAPKERALAKVKIHEVLYNIEFGS